MVDVLVAFSLKAFVEHNLELRVAFLNKKLSEEPRLAGQYADVNRIKVAFEDMSLCFNDAERTMDSNEEERKWVEDLRKIVFDLEVKMNNFIRLHSSHPQRSSMFKRSFAFLSGQDPGRSDFLAGFATKVEAIRRRTPVRLKDELERQRLIYQNGTPSGNMHSLHHHDLKVQREYIDQLQKFMLQEHAGRMDIFVYGKVGTGKSTVVSMAYDRVKRFFQYYVWVRVSGLCDIQDILQSIWRAICKNTSYQVEGNNECISNFLGRLKYLLVLDGMDNFVLVDAVKERLPNDCGKIVITTHEDLHNRDLAHSLEIKPLSSGEDEEFLHKRASPDPGTCVNRTLAQQIVMKLEGSLLGIAIVGSLLSTMNEELVLEQLRNLPDSVEEKVKAFVSIGYANLPPFLKACFIYTCNSISENDEIPKGKLIRMLLAEGLVDHPGSGTSRSETLEEAGERQLIQLIRRNMLAARFCDNTELEACWVPAPMRSFALGMLSESMNQIEGQGSANCWNFGRVLMWRNQNAPKATTITKFNGTRLQSHHPFLLFWQINQRAPALPWGKLKHLNVLNLEGIGSDTLLESVFKRLPLLRFLGLRGAGIKTFPSSLGRLQNLELLDIRDTNVTRLPENCKPIAKLRHLLLAKSFTDKVVDVPLSFISHSTELQTLSGLKFTREGMEELGKLTQIRKLSVGNLMKDHSDMIFSSINGMTSLRSLTLKYDQQERLRIQSVGTLSCLNKLSLGGKFEGLLDWVGRLDSLDTLYLWDCNLTQDPLSALRHLPNLVRLTLNNAYEGECIDPVERGFSKLKYLAILRFRELRNWGAIGTAAMEMLQTLYIKQCPNLMNLPEGLENLCGGLLVVNIAEMPVGFQDSIERQGHSNVHLIEEITRV